MGEKRQECAQLIDRALRLLVKVSESTSRWDRFVAADALNETAHELRACVLKEGCTDEEENHEF